MSEQPRYEVVSQEGGRALAVDRETGAEVVLKELALGRVSDWKELQLFEREARLLKSLDHPAIPKVLDAFRGGGKSPRYYLVTERVDGRPLRDLAGELDQAALLRVARDVLEILVYLQGFSPPVLHRNITAEHILVDDAGRARLIGFGSVQVELKGTAGGSTIVGTSGFMAPEQLLGKAIPATDVYALGASLVEAVTGLDPADLPTERMKLRWMDRARLGTERFHAWIDRMVEPDPAVRFASAEDALLGISGDVQLQRTEGGLMAVRPPNSQVELTRSAQRLEIKFPQRRLQLRDVAGLCVAVAAVVPPVVVPNVLLGSIAFFIAAQGVIDTFRRVRRFVRLRRQEVWLDMDRGFRLTTGKSTNAGPLVEIISVQTGFRGHTDALWLGTEVHSYELGYRLSTEEVDWLQDELRRFLRLRI